MHTSSFFSLTAISLHGVLLPVWCAFGRTDDWMYTSVCKVWRRFVTTGQESANCVMVRIVGIFEAIIILRFCRSDLEISWSGLATSDCWVERDEMVYCGCWWLYIGKCIVGFLPCAEVCFGLRLRVFSVFIMFPLCKKSCFVSCDVCPFILTFPRYRDVTSTSHCARLGRWEHTKQFTLPTDSTTVEWARIFPRYRIYFKIRNN